MKQRGRQESFDADHFPVQKCALMFRMLADEWRKLRGRPDTQQVVEEVDELRDRPDTQRVVEDVRKRGKGMQID
jgi:hypothetical protein